MSGCPYLALLVLLALPAPGHATVWQRQRVDGTLEFTNAPTPSPSWRAVPESEPRRTSARPHEHAPVASEMASVVWTRDRADGVERVHQPAPGGQALEGAVSHRAGQGLGRAGRLGPGAPARQFPGSLPALRRPHPRSAGLLRHSAGPYPGRHQDRVRLRPARGVQCRRAGADAAHAGHGAGHGCDQRVGSAPEHHGRCALPADPGQAFLQDARGGTGRRWWRRLRVFGRREDQGARRVPCRARSRREIRGTAPL